MCCRLVINEVVIFCYAGYSYTKGNKIRLYRLETWLGLVAKDLRLDLDLAPQRLGLDLDLAPQRLGLDLDLQPKTYSHLWHTHTHTNTHTHVGWAQHTLITHSTRDGSKSLVASPSQVQVSKGLSPSLVQVFEGLSPSQVSSLLLQVQVKSQVSMLVLAILSSSNVNLSCLKKA